MKALETSVNNAKKDDVTLQQEIKTLQAEVCCHSIGISDYKLMISLFQPIFNSMQILHKKHFGTVNDYCSLKKIT